MEEILNISNVSKKYRLGMIGGTSLREELQRKRAARKGLEDPTKKVTDSAKGKTGEEFYALSDITISVNKGERVGIIGHSCRCTWDSYRNEGWSRILWDRNRHFRNRRPQPLRRRGHKGPPP